MKRVAVLGGSRFIGRAIVEALLRRGYSVTTVNRGVTPATYSGAVHRVMADRHEPESYLAALKAVDASYVVDVNAYTAGDAALAVEAFRGRIAKLVQIGSLSSYQRPYPCPIPEEWPLDVDPAHSYGFDKAECERRLALEPLQLLPWTVLRLPAVYGPNDPVGREEFFFKRIVAGTAVPLPYGGNFFCQNIFLDDAAEACCRVLESEDSVGRAYNVGGFPFTLNSYLSLAGELLERPVHVTGGQPSPGKEQTPYAYNGNLILDTTRIAGEIGFEPAVTLKEGLQRSFASIQGSRP